MFALWKKCLHFAFTKIFLHFQCSSWFSNCLVLALVSSQNFPKYIFCTKLLAKVAWNHFENLPWLCQSSRWFYVPSNGERWHILVVCSFSGANGWRRQEGVEGEQLPFGWGHDGRFRHRGSPSPSQHPVIHSCWLCPSSPYEVQTNQEASADSTILRKQSSCRIPKRANEIWSTPSGPGSHW